MLISMTSLVYGLIAARSVISEKTNKTLEILISSVKPRKILLGKALGVSAAGLLQFSVWTVIAFSIIRYVIPIIGTDINFDIFTTCKVIIILLYFILGFLFYVLIYSAIGANVETEQNLGQFQIPLQLLVMLPIILNSSITANPNGSLAKFLSYLPFTSPSVMSIRMLVGSPVNFSIFVSVSILFASLIAVLIISSKLFKIGLLSKGKTKTIIDMFKLILNIK